MSVLRQLPAASKLLTKYSTAAVQQSSVQLSTQQADISLPTEADVVVIGGGSLGCNALYHLTKLGVSNAVLLERDNLTSGTTWHTAGLLWNNRASDTETELVNYGHKLLKSIEDETGIFSGWIENGGIFTANNKTRLEEYKRMNTFSNSLGVESYIISPEETKKLYPLMNVSDLAGCLYSPTDGTIDPASFCTALAKGAKTGGAKVFEKCPVDKIHTTESWLGSCKITAVETPYGTIKTSTVISSTGAWSPYIGKMLNCSIPLQPMKHAYVVTEHIDGIKGMPNVRDHDSSVYLRVNGDYLCVGGYEPNPIILDENVKEDFAFSLYELDYDVFSYLLDGAMKRIPVLEKTGIKSTVCGPESFTADEKPILGEDINIRGFYHCYGMNSGGMMLGPGCGREIARWAVHGRPTLDMFGYDIRRFNEDLLANKQWNRERSHEVYGKHYSVHFVHDEALAGRNQIKDPLHKILQDDGCVYQERHGWERPGWYAAAPAPALSYDYYGYYDEAQHENYTYFDKLKGDYTFDYSNHYDAIKKECLTCREAATIFNMSYFGKLYIVGPDAQKAADWIFSNRVDKDAGVTSYTCMLNKFGRTEADLTVSMITSGDGSPCDPKFQGRGFYLAAGGGAAQQNLSHVLSVIRENEFDVQVIDHSQRMGLLSVQGPKSRDILQPLVDVDLSNEAFPFSTHKIAHIANHKLRMMRLTFVGEMGWELHVPFDSMVDVYKAVMLEGKKHGLINSGYRAIDNLSVEKGYRHWHADVRLDDTPLEAGLGFTCKLKTKTDFLGRKAIENQKKEGLKKRLACFTTEYGKPLLTLECIWRNGERVGFVRRAGHAFALNKEIAYGYVSKPNGENVTLDWLKDGKYELEIRGEKVEAVYHPKTPFDPSNNRIKGIY